MKRNRIQKYHFIALIVNNDGTRTPCRRAPAQPPANGGPRDGGPRGCGARGSHAVALGTLVCVSLLIV